jgi:hypothetical protein
MQYQHAFSEPTPEESLPSGPRYADAERGLNFPALAGALGVMTRTFLSGICFVREWRGELNAIMQFTPQRRVAEEISKFYTATSVYKGGLGGLFFDLYARSIPPEDRECLRTEAQIIAALSLCVACGADDLIDQPELPSDKKELVVRDLLNCLETGEPLVSSAHPRTAALQRLAQELRTHAFQLPNPRPFFDAFRVAANTVIDQFDAPPSLEITSRVGGDTMLLCAIIPCCMTNAPIKNMLNAAWALGAHVQVYDDYVDREANKRSGIRTLFTEAENPEELAEDLLGATEMRFIDRLRCCTIAEQRTLRGIQLLLRLNWKFHALPQQ